MAMMTTEQVSEHLSVSARTVRELVKSGALPAARIGKEYRFKEIDVNQFIEERFR
jgi:excisionase family DNA binding protein